MSIFGLGPENTAVGGVEGRSSGRIASFLDSARAVGLIDLFSFEGRIGRKDYWMALLWAHLVPMIACLPFVAWRVFWQPRGFGSGGLGTPGIVVCAVSGAMYYWMLAAAFVKRFHDLGLSGWSALIYLSAVLVFVFELSIGEDQHWPILEYVAARYFRPVLWMTRGWLSGWEALMSYLTPYVFLALLVLQGTIKGATEPDSAGRKRIVAAFVALALGGIVAEVGYSWNGVYREVTSENYGVSFDLDVHLGSLPGYGVITRIDGLRLFLEGSGGKRIEVPLVSQSVLNGQIVTRDFGALKLNPHHRGWDFWEGHLVAPVFATMSQIAKLRAFQSAHQ